MTMTGAFSYDLSVGGISNGPAEGAVPVTATIQNMSSASLSRQPRKAILCGAPALRHENY